MAPLFEFNTPKKAVVTSILLLASMISFSQKVKIDTRTQAALEKVSKEKIRNHIAYLADDKLKGRKPGTEGYRMAVEYVINQFKEIGLTPAGDKGGFTQGLIIRQASTDPTSAVAVLRDKSGNADTLKPGNEIVLMPSFLRNETNLEAPMVFVGYGIDIPGKYSDYDGIDVKGKFVVVLSGSPQHLGLTSTLVSHFGSAGSKLEVASQKGAAGIMIASRTPTGRIPAPRATVAMNPDKTAAYGRSAVDGLQTVTYATYKTLQRLFFNSDRSLNQTLDELVKEILNPSPKHFNKTKL